jgi:galactosyl transferase GMA12/MNN10 family
MLRRLKALCTIASGPFAPLFEIARPGFEGFAARHGWTPVIETRAEARGRPPAWAKILLLADLLERFELVAWLDADALIVDGSQDLASELRRRRDFYLVQHRWHSTAGQGGAEITANAGVMMFRSGRWAQRFLAAVWAQEDLIEHRWWENAAIMRLLGYRIDPQPVQPERRTRWLRRVRYLDVAWNVTPLTPCPSPRVCHFAGLPLEQRAAGMAELLVAEAPR